MLAIIKKELSSYFKTPIGYIFLAAYAAIYGVFFVDFFTNYVAAGGSASFHYTFNPMITVMTFLIPIITMRLFSEERKQGTELMLLSSPTKTISIVVGKFIAASIMVLIAVLITLIFAIITLFCTKANFEFSLLFSTCIGFVLLSLTYVAIGMLFSILTENQIIAFILTVAFLFLIWFTQGFELFAPARRYELFVQGAMAWKDIVFFITYIVSFLTIDVIFLENRKWNK